MAPKDIYETSPTLEIRKTLTTDQSAKRERQGFWCPGYFNFEVLKFGDTAASFLLQAILAITKFVSEEKWKSLHTLEF